MKPVKSIAFFSNGNYMVFDEDGEQRADLQMNPQATASVLAENPKIQCSIGDMNGMVECNPEALFYLLARLKTWAQFKKEWPNWEGSKKDEANGL